ncbi:hypothetical protein MGYG_07798 [Nannizzia gypsea CBS 118893]|uniref:Uncharacterized protein n=1 Tax=Arthroderma gypseum (strain ATCC MYA-4604 / CBS 118893) TaxID=535722 RepID=E4V467_ARTGP|nr:hypothetical protein MGYG_07798 [Nannizzia gypsea CBS 118893]EFR04791.1 hypothetical protein MGYG_07798 [Nannizzia gypsea CBS 118893]
MAKHPKDLKKASKKKIKGKQPEKLLVRQPVLFYSSRLPPRPVTHRPRPIAQAAHALRPTWRRVVITWLGWRYYHYGLAIPVHGMHPIEILIINGSIIAVIAAIIWVVFILLPIQLQRMLTILFKRR